MKKIIAVTITFMTFIASAAAAYGAEYADVNQETGLMKQ